MTALKVSNRNGVNVATWIATLIIYGLTVTWVLYENSMSRLNSEEVVYFLILTLVTLVVCLVVMGNDLFNRDEGAFYAVYTMLFVAGVYTVVFVDAIPFPLYLAEESVLDERVERLLGFAASNLAALGFMCMPKFYEFLTPRPSKW